MPYLRDFWKPFNFLLFMLIATPVLAHSVQMSGDVGATMHIEPHDDPHAGRPTTAWFITTHRGGRILTLAKCNCRLEIYKVPHDRNARPLLTPDLVAVTGDNYQGIPGAKITFPQVGAYELRLSGSPKYPPKNSNRELPYNDRFTPFTLTYKVIVLP